MANNDRELRTYRAALVSIGYFYEDYDGPLSPEEIEVAKSIIAEREKRVA